MKVSRDIRQPRLLIEIRHYIRGWVNLMTEGGVTVMVERTTALMTTKRAADALLDDGKVAANDEADPTLEGYKTSLRQATYDAGNNVDGRSIVLPWCDRFDLYDVDNSGLLGMKALSNQSLLPIAIAMAT